MQEGNLIKLLNTSVDMLGIEGTAKWLEKGIEDHCGDEYVLFVIKTVTGLVGISLDQLKERGVDERRKVCIGFCAHYLNKEFNYSYSDIASKFPVKLTRESLFRYAKLIKKAKLEKPKSEIDKLISANLQKIGEIIQNHKSKPSNETFINNTSG